MIFLPWVMEDKEDVSDERPNGNAKYGIRYSEWLGQRTAWREQVQNGGMQLDQWKAIWVSFHAD